MVAGFGTFHKEEGRPRHGGVVLARLPPPPPLPPRSVAPDPHLTRIPVRVADRDALEDLARRVGVRRPSWDVFGAAVRVARRRPWDVRLALDQA